MVITDGDPAGEGGLGFELPAPGTPRLASLRNPAATIPDHVNALYLAASDRYQLPWTLLASVGMEETAHGRIRATSSAGAQGLMQFMPATWARYGVDGSGDGRADIGNDADSVMSAANYLTVWGHRRRRRRSTSVVRVQPRRLVRERRPVLRGRVRRRRGRRRSIQLRYRRQGNPALPALANQQIATVLEFATAQLGEPYVYGANGPTSWDCSAFTRAAFAQIGITLPRTAAAQQNWVAQGMATRCRSARSGLAI